MTRKSLKGNGIMLRSTLKFVKGAAIGATTTYYLDPDRGRARRARLRDQLLAAGRRGARSAGRRARYQLGRVKGRAMRSLGRGRFEPVDDRLLAGHLRGVLGRVQGPTDQLTTEVVDGVVRLRGEVASPADRQRIVSALACEPGVVRVEDLTHLPGEGPPNKADSLDAARRAPRGRRAG
jgi:hyperosmotically inducible periplasmic protein